MKIKLIEPLSISEDLLNEYKNTLENEGHEFISYENKPKDEKDYSGF